MVYSVIGSNYGDEGKGLATDYLASQSASTLVVRHNGGAQSGHTVEIEDKRFVFHELSSGSFRGADTYWADSYYPDLYKLDEEMEAFYGISGIRPRIFASFATCITTIDDILINMLLESSRAQRHGSCGMGINEADLRKKAGFGVNLGQIKNIGEAGLLNELKRIRREYSKVRLAEISCGELKNVDFTSSEYWELLQSDAVLENYAHKVHENFSYISELVEVEDIFGQYENVIFEGGQGLRLDADFEASMPHVTASKTGLYNVRRLLGEVNITQITENAKTPIGGKHDSEVNITKIEAVYVTRSYVTKHGAGPLPHESAEFRTQYDIVDNTNLVNDWQGGIRFACWENPEDLTAVIKDDLKLMEGYVEAGFAEAGFSEKGFNEEGYADEDDGSVHVEARNDTKLCKPIKASLFITHLNETDGQLLFANGNKSIEDFLSERTVKEIFDKFYLSYTPYAGDVKVALDDSNTDAGGYCK